MKVILSSPNLEGLDDEINTRPFIDRTKKKNITLHSQELVGLMLVWSRFAGMTEVPGALLLYTLL